MLTCQVTGNSSIMSIVCLPVLNTDDQDSQGGHDQEEGANIKEAHNHGEEA